MFQDRSKNFKDPIANKAEATETLCRCSHSESAHTLQGCNGVSFLKRSIRNSLREMHCGCRKFEPRRLPR
jgi:hypothetical protein